jgi:hypothetical protein
MILKLIALLRLMTNNAEAVDLIADLIVDIETMPKSLKDFYEMLGFTDKKASALEYVSTLDDYEIAKLFEAVPAKPEQLVQLEEGIKMLVDPNDTRKVECIRCIKHATGMGLKDSKDFVERIKAWPSY